MAVRRTSLGPATPVEGSTRRVSSGRLSTSTRLPLKGAATGEAEGLAWRKSSLGAVTGGGDAGGRKVLQGGISQRLTAAIPRSRLSQGPSSTGSPDVTAVLAISTPPSTLPPTSATPPPPPQSPSATSSTSTIPASRRIPSNPRPSISSSTSSLPKPQSSQTITKPGPSAVQRRLLNAPPPSSNRPPPSGLASLTELTELSPAKKPFQTDRMSKRSSMVSLPGSQPTRLPRPASMALLRTSTVVNKSSAPKAIDSSSGLKRLPEEPTEPSSTPKPTSKRASAAPRSAVPPSRNRTNTASTDGSSSAAGGSPGTLRAAAFAKLTGSTTTGASPGAAASRAYADLSGSPSPSPKAVVTEKLESAIKTAVGKLGQGKAVISPVKTHIPIPTTLGTPSKRTALPRPLGSPSASTKLPLPSPTKPHKTLSTLSQSSTSSIPIPTSPTKLPTSTPIALPQPISFPSHPEPSPAHLSHTSTPRSRTSSTAQSDIDSRLESSLARLLDSPSASGESPLVRSSLGRNSLLISSTGEGRPRMSLAESWLGAAGVGGDSPGASPSPMRIAKGNLLNKLKASTGEPSRMRALREEGKPASPSSKFSSPNSPSPAPSSSAALKAEAEQAALRTENEKLKQQLSVLTTELYTLTLSSASSAALLSAQSTRLATLSAAADDAARREKENQRRREAERVAERWEEVVRCCEAELGVLEAGRKGVEGALAGMEVARGLLGEC